MTEHFEEVYEATYHTISFPAPSTPLEKLVVAMSQLLLNMKTEMEGLDTSMKRYSNSEEKGNSEFMVAQGNAIRHYCELAIKTIGELSINIALFTKELEKSELPKSFDMATVKKFQEQLRKEGFPKDVQNTMKNLGINQDELDEITESVSRTDVEQVDVVKLMEQYRTSLDSLAASLFNLADAYSPI